MKNWDYALYSVECTFLSVFFFQVRYIVYTKGNCLSQWHSLLIQVLWDLWKAKKLLKFGFWGLLTWYWGFIISVHVCMCLCVCVWVNVHVTYRAWICTCAGDLLSKVILLSTLMPWFVCIFCWTIYPLTFLGGYWHSCVSN